MNKYEDSQAAPRAGRSEPGSSGRKPYRKPGFRHERVFETSALHCGKLPNATQGECKGAGRNS
jgi:ribosomal protein L4